MMNIYRLLFFYHKGANDAEDRKEKNLDISSPQYEIGYEMGYDDYINETYDRQVTVKEVHKKVINELVKRLKNKYEMP